MANINEIIKAAMDLGIKQTNAELSRCWIDRVALANRRPITTEAIGSAATHPSLRGALATKQSRGHNMRGASNPDGRTAAPGLLRFARNDGQGIGLLVSACRLNPFLGRVEWRCALSYRPSEDLLIRG